MILPRMIHLSSIQTGLSAQMTKSWSRVLVRTRTAFGDGESTLMPPPESRVTYRICPDL